MAKQWIDNETAIMAEDMNRLENQVQISVNEPEYKGDLWIEASKNLFDKNIAKNNIGYPFRENGIINYDTNWRYVFIQVKPNVTYTCSGVTNENLGTGVTLYNGDTFISSPLGYQNGSFITTNETTRICVPVPQDSLETFMIEVGDVTSNYEPYITSSIKANVNGEYKKITDTVNIGLNNNNAGLWVEVSENLYHKECIINNSTIDGEGRIVNFEGYNIFIIKVDGGKTYTMSNGTVRNYLYGFYREMPGISSIGSGRIIRENILNETFIVPNGYKYLAIRCELNEGEIPNLMLNYGNGPLPYKQNVIPNIKANINGDYISVNNYNNEVILYNNNSGGTLDNIILGDNVENYEYLEIYFRSADGVDNYIKISNPHDKLCALNVMDLRPGDDNYTIIRSRFIHIINNQIYNDNIAGIVKTGYAVVRAGGGTYTVEENQICITKVVGIK